jgi:hypothetical protein
VFRQLGSEVIPRYLILSLSRIIAWITTKTFNKGGDNMAVIKSTLSNFDKPLTKRLEDLGKFHVSSYSEDPEDSFIDKLEKNFGYAIIGMILLGALVGIVFTFI